jgi:hypothetical protein
MPCMGSSIWAVPTFHFATPLYFYFTRIRIDSIHVGRQTRCIPQDSSRIQCTVLKVAMQS